MTSLAVSPCPNDTFLVHALVHGLVATPTPVEISYDDIDVLNARAARAEPDLVKVSFGALPWLLDDYQLLDAGSALGRGCGPLVVIRSGADHDLTDATIAVPGERTTAYLLLRLWAHGRSLDVRVMPFDHIMPAVAAGTVQAGLIIHESRFTYPTFGLVSVVDLGQWWEQETGLPIPLGCMLARKGLPMDLWSAALRESLAHAWAGQDDPALRSYVSGLAQEMDPKVQQAHIRLYVTDFTRDRGPEGDAAVRELLQRSAAAGLTPAIAR